ncbi:MAG: phosphoribosylaminoimidazolesuccinocarboxamide synthase [Elusimicrobiota bacterium]|jgi:phosphoribosylaminoimidazole-succinocarboxamide synthase|nr:phosphoribosylaminoimidazolesuccinocarboxamide synthase [Elusimicrobiota bacterium]
MKIDLPLLHRGKVRDIYDLGDNLLICASDRISAFDCVIPTEIPNKGKILHKLSMFWFDFVKDIAANHIITGEFSEFPDFLKKYDYLDGRAMIVKKAKRIDIECIARNYLSGSAWKEYELYKTVCSMPLPDGLKESSKLPNTIFTPSSKEDGGAHDENISFEETKKRIGDEAAETIKNLTLKIYQKASDFALSKGIILADTKFEFGYYNNKIILIDEIFTPDSSRFWEAAKYQEGKAQDSLDKQFVRDYLEKIKWDKKPPAPNLPDEIVKKTLEKYIEAYEKLTGKRWQ